MNDGMMEYEGTILPSYLRGQPSPMMSSLPLRFGRVIKIRDVGTQDNKNTSFTEYDVLIEEGSEHAAPTRYVIPRCLVISAFGGVADFTRWTPRITQDFANKDDFGLGSRVLVLCVNASSYKGIILGGVQNAGTKEHPTEEKDDPSLGHHGTFQFNGIRFDIDKDGQLTLLFRGATKDDNSLTDSADPAAEGTTLTITKDGSFKVFTKDDAQHLLIDHKNKVIDILADTDWKVKSKGKFTLESAQQTDLTVSTGNCSITVKAGQHRIDSLGVFCGAQAVDAFVKGTTYRIAETTMHTTMLGALATLAAAGAALNAAAAALSAAGGSVTAAATAMKVPVAGAVAGSIPLNLAGGSLVGAGASTAAAGASVIAAASTLTAAISTFEGGTASYLSLKNFCD